MLGYIILWSVIGGIAGFLGAVLIVFKVVKKREHTLYLVGFAAGSMLAAVFFDLLPEAMELAGNTVVPLTYVLYGIILFYCLEKLFLWQHCHRHAHGEVCEVHVGSRMVIIGDSMHNFLDGVAIAAAFLVSAPLGVVTALAVFVHEIPQEVGDVGVLLHDGFSRKQALVWNFISAAICVVGAVLAYFLMSAFETIEIYLVAIAAGGFIYVATSDLLPEIHRELKKKHILAHTIVFLLGVIVIWLVSQWLHV